MAAIPYVDGDSVQQNLDRVRTYYELLNMPFEVSQRNNSWFVFRFSQHFYTQTFTCFFLQALLAFIAEHDQMFTPTESVSSNFDSL